MKFQIILLVALFAFAYAKPVPEEEAPEVTTEVKSSEESNEAVTTAKASSEESNEAVTTAPPSDDKSDEKSEEKPEEKSEEKSSEEKTVIDEKPEEVQETVNLEDVVDPVAIASGREDEKYIFSVTLLRNICFFLRDVGIRS